MSFASHPKYRPVSKRPVGAKFDRGDGQCQMAAKPLQTHTTLPRQENRFAQNCTPRTDRLDWWKGPFLGCAGIRSNLGTASLRARRPESRIETLACVGRFHRLYLTPESIRHAFAVTIFN